MSFVDSLRDFHSRDWKADISSLNRELARGADGDAGFQHSPPSILTGDPLALEAGRCVLIVGINPGWPNEDKQRIDSTPAQGAWMDGFDDYRVHRASYFAEASGRPGRTKQGDVRYNGQHFSRLGNTISHALGLVITGWNAGPTARRFFRERAAIFDLLPYWSTNVKRADLARAGDQASVQAWHGVIAAFIREKRPSAIIVNNCHQRMLIGKMLETGLEAVDGTDFYAGRSELAGSATPVLAHPFLSHWRRSRDDYVAGVARWGAHVRAVPSELVPPY